MNSIDDFVLEYLPEIQRFVVFKLAEILYHNVDHDLPRDKVDLETSETFVKKTLNVEEYKALTRQFLVLCAYDSLRRKRPELPLIRYDLMLPDNDNYAENSRLVSSTLSRLSKDKLVSLIGELSLEERKRHLDLILGRHVWELYQEIQKSELLIEGCYGIIRFY